ncbi:MAG: hypothetical protein DI548_03825 [Flavobacterium johnsoniae]|nr:MAG: hypothetical protein DI548_03825 [Flavobacterium johnsoniae]
MINNTDISSKSDTGNSFKNAHVLGEFAKILHKFGDDIEQSVGLFDAIQEKNELFIKFEESMQRPIESIINMQNISQKQIYDFVFNSFQDSFSKYQDKFNFVHYHAYENKNIIFFISTIDDKTKEIFESLEYDYFIGEISNYVRLEFCFVESDMEKDLLNTNKLEFINGEKLRKQS